MLDPCTGRPAILAVGGRRQRYSFTRATALGRASRQHLESWSGILQADAYGGYGKRYDAERGPAPILDASCWAHARRKFHELVDIVGGSAARRNVMHGRRSRRSRWKRCSASTLCPISSAASTVCRPISGSPCARSKARRLIAALEAWMREERRKLSRHTDVAGASRLRRPPEDLPRQRGGYREDFACAARWRQPPGKAGVKLDSTGAGAGAPAARRSAAEALIASANR